MSYIEITINNNIILFKEHQLPQYKKISDIITNNAHCNYNLLTVEEVLKTMTTEYMTKKVKQGEKSE